MPQRKPLDLNLLRVFAVVCRTESFSKAAEELDLTQSSVSNAIARLKARVGEALFVRVGRGVKPTAAALNLYRHLAGPLAEIEQLVAGLEAFDPKLSQRTFTVYANDTIIELLQAAAEEHLSEMRVEIIFKEAPVQEQDFLKDLQTEKVDLAIDVSKPQEAGFDVAQILQERIVCVARQLHPRIQGSLSFEQYFAEKHIIFNLRRFNLKVVDMLTTQVLPERKVYCEQSSLLSMIATAAKSDALAIVTESYAREYAELFKLQVFEPPFETKPLNIYMLWSKRLAQNPANLWLRQTLVSLLQAQHRQGNKKPA
ncbi:LysR family transcriptional regulator [Shewanella sp. Isolate8]|uniref:LysR family transcriptional regulator n=1 Tax=Shewanella sp. Isolate8 TaxID=2908529 RepID=UPI001EFD6E08|nr:LysR family transcriptional regulator [Shewanella sp. Isolate8]MCG9747167.1 LysR family transcriptional regulator [Shewanella sp. Isolate8]